MSKRHVVDVLAQPRTVVSLSGLDIGSRVKVSVSPDDPIAPGEILSGELVDVKHGRGVPSLIGVMRDDGSWVWRRVQASTEVRFES